MSKALNRPLVTLLLIFASTAALAADPPQPAQFA